MTLLFASGFNFAGSTIPNEAPDGTGSLTVGTGAYTDSGHTGPGFENTGTSVSTGASGSVGSVSGATCSLMAWVKPIALPSNTTQLICGSLDLSGTDFALWSQRGDFGTHNVLQGNARLGGGPVPINGPALTVGVWAHVALTYDGTTLKLFKDGSLVTSVSNTNTVNNRTAFAVAGLGGSGGYQGRNTVDDIRYFNSDESANVETWMNTPVGSIETSGVKIYDGSTWVDSGAVQSYDGSTWAVSGKPSIL